MHDHVTYRGLLYQFVHVAQIVKIPGVVQLMIMSDKKNILISYPSSVPNRHIQILHKHTAKESTVYNEKKTHTHTYTKQKHSDFSTIRFLNLRAETNQYFFSYIFCPVFYVCMNRQKFHRYLHHCIPIMGPHFPGVQYLYFSVYNFLGSCHVSYTFVTSCS